MMDRPKIDKTWEWREYADGLEAEREEASQDYADLLKDYRALRKIMQELVDDYSLGPIERTKIQSALK
jgi:hypothetical protein